MARNVRNLNEFYGYPVALIARWLGVSIRTARRYKAGHRVPRPALRLFTLCRNRKVLGPEWDGWAVKEDRLVSPEDTELTQSSLRAYYLVYQLAAELAKRDAAIAEELDAIKRIASR